MLVQIRPEKIRRQLLQPNYAKVPEKSKNYNEVPKTFAPRTGSTPPSPAIAAAEEIEPRHELEEPHRTKALEGDEVDTRSAEQDEAIGDRATTGAAPRPLQLQDPGVPSTTSAAEGRTCPIQPATIHITHKQLRIEEKRGQQKQKHHLTKAMKHWPRTPVQELPNSPLAPESRTNGARRSWSIIPSRHHHHRLADAARTSTP